MPVFKRLEFDRRLLEIEPIITLKLWRECTPKILVVTDGLNYSPASGFGLSQFVATLKGASIHAMTPIVSTASRLNTAGADHVNYRFDDATHGLRKDRFDVLFMFGSSSEGDYELDDTEIDAIHAFMQQGGGVFATGDHDTLGAALCGDIGRVRQMRRWKTADAPPHVANTARHSTNLSGSDETEEFDDQSDALPQRLYLNYRSQAGGSANIDRAAHPLMQMTGRRRVLEVFPDHPHEGECVLPAQLTGQMPVAGAMLPLWPKDAAGNDVAPEMVAYSVSHGDGFASGPTGPKLGLVPKLFGAVAAYDGQRAGVGRVATDSTWHHFININLDGTGAGAGFSGLKLPASAGGADSDELSRIRQYYINLATWLMPAKVRRCLRYPRVFKELVKYPLFEELALPRPGEPALPALQALGATLAVQLARTQPAWQVQEMADDLIEETLGEAGLALLLRAEASTSALLTQLREVALGALVQGMALEISELPTVQDLRPHKSFEGSVREAARAALAELLKARRKQLSDTERLLDGLAPKR